MRTRLAGTLVAVLAAVLPAPASAITATVPTWVAAPVVPVPPGTTSSVLNDVTVLSPDDVWAVGGWVDSGTHPLAVHWDGTRWTAASVPHLSESAHDYSLSAVDGLGPDRVWAVGAAPGDTDPLILLRYDGTGWSAAPGPSAPVDRQSVLTDLDMRSVDDGWAVGQTALDTGVAQPLILRWRADRWTRVPAPAIAAESRLTGVYAGSEDEAWAVGERERDGGGLASLVLHWDGEAWTEVTVPDTGGATNDLLSGVAGATGTDVWAVGSTCPAGDPAACQPLALHLHEKTWQRVPASSARGVLTDAVVFGPDDVWLVGHVSTRALVQLDHVEHWDGRRLTTDDTVRGASPPVSGGGKPASALALAAAAGDRHRGVLWAVGWSQGVNVLPRAIYRR